MKSRSELPTINGKTRLYVTIGHPIEHVASPGFMTRRFRAAGLNALFVPLDVRPEFFLQTILCLKKIANLDGLIVTLPYKTQAVAFVDELGPIGKRVEAINAMRRDQADGRWVGEMFDGRGMIRALKKRNAPPEGLRVMLLGAGGAGSAIADALADAGASALTIYDTDQAKAEALANRIRGCHPACSVKINLPTIVDHDVLLNATPIGMKPEDPPVFDLGKFRDSLLVVDIVVPEYPTQLLLHARACGCRVIDGEALGEGQVDDLMDFFLPQLQA